MYLYDTHVHTHPVSACATSTPEEQVIAYKNRGYSGIILTDHFSAGYFSTKMKKWSDTVDFVFSGYERAKLLGDEVGLDVFFGLEYTTEGLDFLTYGIDKRFLLQNPCLGRGVTIEQYSRLVRKYGGYLAQAHPFRTAFWISNPRCASPELIDGIEAINTSDSSETNRQALLYAKKAGLPIQSGSDSHDARLPYDVGGIKLSQKAENIFDIVSAIKTFRVRLLTGGLPGM